MAQLDASKRARLPNSAFAYVDSKGRKRLPINDEAHVRNALARFDQVVFEDESARDRARTRLLAAAKKYGIVPIGFMTGQLRTRSREAVAGRLVIELGRLDAPGEVEERLRVELGDPTLIVLHWSESADGYLDGTGRAVQLPSTEEGRAVTLLERRGRPMTALVHDPGILQDPRLVKNVTAAVRLAIENERLHGEVEARASEVRTLPTGFVTFLISDVEDSTGLLRSLGDRYAPLLDDVRRILRSATRRSHGREVDARADEFFAVFGKASDAVEAALSVQRAMRDRAWPDERQVRLRIGIHSGHPTLTDTGYVGIAVNTAARVSSAGHGGQVLITAATRNALESSPVADVTLRDLGAYRLQGLPAPESLVQVVVPDLPHAFPAPRRSAKG